MCGFKVVFDEPVVRGGHRLKYLRVPFARVTGAEKQNARRELAGLLAADYARFPGEYTVTWEEDVYRGD